MSSWPSTFPFKVAVDVGNDGALGLDRSRPIVGQLNRQDDTFCGAGASAGLFYSSARMANPVVIWLYSKASSSNE